jgi:hypothetical protein
MSEDRYRIPHLESPPDVSLLLLAHSEQHLLSREVIPVVRQLETGERLPEEQLPAATAYLEVIWAEAAARARQTDAALHQLELAETGMRARGECPPASVKGECLPASVDLARQPFPARARRYHAAVRALREAVARRVLPLIAAPAEARADRQARLLDRQGRLPDLIP